MDSKVSRPSTIIPSEEVCGMTCLDRKRFSRVVSVPCLRISSNNINAISKTLKGCLFKMPKIKSVAELSLDDPQHKSHKLFLFDPNKYQTFSDFSEQEVAALSKCGVDVQDLDHYDIELGYENWTAHEILRAVIPAGLDSVSGFSIIGHIAHLNLRDELNDYKHLIGQVLLDKNPVVRTVVNKVNIIDNTFRNFQMELLAGEDNFVTQVKENGCVFELDFSKVYWNSRLSSEHQRVVDQLQKGDVLYDVFAGVGPFAIPAGKKGVTVFANDLNPHSHSAILKNIRLNKVKDGHVQAYCMDGRDFIKTIVKTDIIKRLTKMAKVTTLDTGVYTNELESCDGEKVHNSKAGFSDVNISDAQSTPVVSDTLESSPITICTPESQDNFVASHESQNSKGKMYIVMNLPALALEFMDVFQSLLSDSPQSFKSSALVLSHLPIVICYCFSKSEDPVEDARSRAESVLKEKLPADCSVRVVRNVAPNKEMLCVMFGLSPSVLFASDSRDGILMTESQSSNEQPASKKVKLS